jgi:ankyrin repeat protein
VQGAPDLIHALHKTGKLDLEIRNNSGQTPFFRACVYAKIECIELLISMGCDTTVRDNDDMNVYEVYGSMNNTLLPDKHHEHIDRIKLAINHKHRRRGPSGSIGSKDG